MTNSPPQDQKQSCMRDASTEKNRFRGRPGFLPSYFVRRDVTWKGRWSEIRNMLSASMCITSAGGRRSARERTRLPPKAPSQRSGSSHSLPPPEHGEVSGQKVLEVQGGHCCLSCRLDHKGKPPSDRLAASPQAKSCLLPEKALALRVTAELAGRQARAAALSARDGRGVRLPSGGRPSSPRVLAVHLLHVVEEVTEELIPEEHEAGGESSLQQAGGQALEEARGAFLS